MKTTYIAIGYACNQRCRFCPCTKEQARYPFIKLDELKDTVSHMLEDKNIDSIVISGGEPTLHPNFEELISYLNTLGLSITVLSNSEKFFDRNFVRKVCSGIDCSKLSVITTMHSQNFEEHEWANQTKGSFNRSLIGLKNLVDAGILVTIKHCITKLNYKDLAKFYTFIDNYFDDSVEIQLCSIDYCGLKQDEIEDQMMPFPELSRYLEEAFDLHIENEEKGRRRNLYCINMPLCSSDPYYWRFFTQKLDGYSGYVSPDSRGDSKYTYDVEKNVCTSAEECKKCIVESICAGTYKTAFDYYGSKIVKAYIE